MDRSLSPPVRVLLTLVAASACQEPGDEPAAWREVEAAIPVDDAILCDEPTSVEIEDYAFVPSPAIDGFLEGSLTDDGAQLDFGVDAPPGSWVASVALALGPTDDRPDTRTFVDLDVRGMRVRIVGTYTREEDRDFDGLVLDAGTRTFAEVRLLQQFEFRTQRRGVSVDLLQLSLIDPNDDTVAMHRGDFDVASPPSTCLEEALVRFGPVPWNMPHVTLPHLESCTHSECVGATEGWIRANHHAWRINQMLEILADQPSTFRSFLWGQPGLDANHDPAGLSGSQTSPEYYFGVYDDERFDAVKEAAEAMWLNLSDAWFGGHAFTLHCKDCGGWYGAHPSLGTMHVCEDAFIDAKGLYDPDQDAVTSTIIHELMHHKLVHYKGLLPIVDTMSHGHGSTCGVDFETERHYGIDEIRHLATYEASDGEGCLHQDKVVRAADAYALFAMGIGERIRDGKLAYWPKYADPTPQPPTCTGGPGCLCETEPTSGTEIGPDGDGGPDVYCEDNEGETTCQETQVNAGAIVGICVLCDDVRGPGCSCDDQMPCEVGECWGADTQNGGVGHCYRDPPPSYACLADCQALFYDQNAYCYHDHLGGARCMDSDCPPWIADDCYAQNLVCREGECMQECNYYENPYDDHPVSCQDAGYPAPFECVGYRCEVP